MEWIGYLIAGIVGMGLIGAAIVTVYTFVLAREWGEYHSDGYDDWWEDERK